MTKIGRHCFVSGIVQGVFYRHHTKEQATKRNLTGWVKNLDDGRVEVLMFGEEENVLNMLEWLAIGPPKALVTSLEVHETKLESYSTFEVLREL